MSRRGRTLVTTSLYLRPDQVERVASEAAAYGLDQAMLIRGALDHLFEWLDVLAPDERLRCLAALRQEDRAKRGKE